MSLPGTPTSPITGTTDGPKKARAWWFWAVFGVALSLRLAVFCGLPHISPCGDFPLYNGMAENLIAGKGLSFDYDGNGVPEEQMVEPVLPAVLAVFKLEGDADFDRLRLMQLVLSSLICGFVYLLGRRLFGAPAGLFAGLAVALFPAQIVAAQEVNQEIYASFFLTAAVVLLVRSLERPRAGMFFSGLSFGFAVLSKEVALFYPVLLGLGLLWQGIHRVARSGEPRPGGLRQAVRSFFRAAAWRRLLHAGLLFALGSALVLAPWFIRNLRVRHLNAAYEHAPLVANWQAELLPLSPWKMLNSHEGFSTGQKLRYALAVPYGNQYWSQLLGGPDRPLSEELLSGHLSASGAVKLINLAAYWLLVVAGVAGVAMGLRSSPEATATAMLVLYFIAVVMVHPLPLNRFFYPATPYLPAFAALALQRLRLLLPARGRAAVHQP